jgi:hypothetical protein
VAQTIEVVGKVHTSAISPLGKHCGREFDDRTRVAHQWAELDRSGTLQPGVGAIQTQSRAFALGGDRGNRGCRNQITVAGARPEQNSYRVDGASADGYNNAASGSVRGASYGGTQSRSFRSQRATIPPGTSDGVVVPLRVPGRTSTVEGLTSFKGTAPWAREITLTTKDRVGYHPLSAISSEPRPAAHSEAQLFVFGIFRSKGIGARSLVPSPEDAQRDPEINE